MKKKILFINGHLNTGGVEKSLVDILRHFDFSKYEIDLLLLEEKGDFIDELPSEVHVCVKSLKNTYGALFSCLLRCFRQRDWFSLKMRLIFLLMKFRGQDKIRHANKLLTDNIEYDCVIGFRPGICTQIAAFAVNAKKRITWWHHGEINVDRKSYKELADKCNTVVAVSESCREMLISEFPDLVDKVTVVPNMVDTESIREKANEFIPYDEGYHIVSVGRLSKEKHFENAIYAADSLIKKGFNFKWHIIGDGSEKVYLNALIEELNIGSTVILEGNKTNPYPYIKCANLFVHPSHVESQGLVVLEAMALGIPCVVTKSMGPCEFIQDGINGILAKQNPDSLTEKTFDAISNIELYNHLIFNTRCSKIYLPTNVFGKIDALMT